MAERHTGWHTPGIAPCGLADGAELSHQNGVQSGTCQRRSPDAIVSDSREKSFVRPWTWTPESPLEPPSFEAN